MPLKSLPFVANNVGRVIIVIHCCYLQFPVSELKRLLAFENEEQTREFCANYGLTTDGSDMMMLDRVAYVEPESSIPAWRAKELVESKLHVSVGEVLVLTQSSCHSLT